MNWHGSSLAVGQVAVSPERTWYPLFPVLSAGCPSESTDSVQYPLEVAYDTDRLDSRFFDQAGLPGLDRWQAMLPPLADGLSMGEGGTPLVADSQLAAWAGYDGPLLLKNEAANPTGSHKDRLNLCTVSAALAEGAEGIVVASSGNHAISAAAYARRAGIGCIALVSESLGGASARWLMAYSPAAIRVPREQKWPLLRRLQEVTGFHPVSNLTDAHTGHPFGPEGYKTIAYEIRGQLGGAAPAAVFIPTGYGEMLFGVHRGFQELAVAGLIDRVPQLFACEPAARGPLAKAIASGQPTARVKANPTIAGGIACRVSSYRGVVAVTESNGGSPGHRRRVTRRRSRAQRAGLLARAVVWRRRLRQIASTRRLSGPVVCILPSRGVKTQLSDAPDPELPRADSWETLTEALGMHYQIEL